MKLGERDLLIETLYRRREEKRKEMTFLTRLIEQLERDHKNELELDRWREVGEM